jgi:hypothetical protein
MDENNSHEHGIQLGRFLEWQRVKRALNSRHEAKFLAGGVDRDLTVIELRDIAHRRCEGLLHPNIIGSTSIQKLIESAYLQGVNDGVTAHIAQEVSPDA